MSRDTVGCHMQQRVGGTLLASVGTVKDAAKHLIMMLTVTVPHNQELNYLAPNVNNAKAEKPGIDYLEPCLEGKWQRSDRKSVV